MKKEKEIDLLHALFPHARAELLRLLFRERTSEKHVRGLARESGFSLSTTQHELKRLLTAGLVLTHTDGFHRFYQANGGHPLFPILRQLVRIGASDWAFVNQRKRPRRRRAGRRRDPLRHSNFLTSLGINRRPR
jgi:DNA-binding transcriptional ArsR family regulator